MTASRWRCPATHSTRFGYWWSVAIRSASETSDAELQPTNPPGSSMPIGMWAAITMSSSSA